MRAPCWGLLVVGFAACGASENRAPVVKPAPAKTLVALAPSPPALVEVAAPKKRLQVPFAGAALPEPEALENAMARGGEVAGVGTSGVGIEVGVGGLECIIAKGDRLSDDVLPNPRIAPELEAHGLSDAEGSKLAKSAATADITCQAAESGGPREAELLAESVATALASLLDGLIYDPQPGRFWPAAAWTAARADPPPRRRFDVHRAIRVEARGSAGRVWVETRGMVAFGRPDLSFFPVLRDQVATAREQLLVLADAVIAGPPIGSGTTMQVGPTTVLFLDRGTYLKTLPADTPGADEKPPDPSAGQLVVVLPDAAPGNVEAVDRLVHRLSVQ